MNIVIDEEIELYVKKIDYGLATCQKKVSEGFKTLGIPIRAIYFSWYLYNSVPVDLRPKVLAFFLQHLTGKSFAEYDRLTQHKGRLEYPKDYLDVREVSLKAAELTHPTNEFLVKEVFASRLGCLRTAHVILELLENDSELERAARFFVFFDEESVLIPYKWDEIPFIPLLEALDDDGATEFIRKYEDVLTRIAYIICRSYCFSLLRQDPFSFVLDIAFEVEDEADRKRILQNAMRMYNVFTIDQRKRHAMANLMSFFSGVANSASEA